MTLCKHRMSVAKLRDDGADASLAVSLAGALQDVLDAVNHLLGGTSMNAGLHGSKDGASTCEEVATFSFRSFQRLCLRRLNLLVVAKLRDDGADAGLAVSLASALQDVLDAVNHLLGRTSMNAGLHGSKDGASTSEEVATFSFRYFQRLCLRRLNLHIVAKLRDNGADAGLAVSLAGALQDVLDAVNHLL